MPSNTETAPTSTREILAVDSQDNWGWLLILGVSTIFSVIGFSLTFALTSASVLFFGLLILAGSVFQLLVHAFTCKGWRIRHDRVSVRIDITA